MNDYMKRENLDLTFSLCDRKPTKSSELVVMILFSPVSESSSDEGFVGCTAVLFFPHHKNII